MKIKLDSLAYSLLKIRHKINQKIKKLKIKLGLVKDRKKDLAQVELKLRSMRAIATKIRDEDLDDSEQEQLVKRFNNLNEELNIKF